MALPAIALPLFVKTWWKLALGVILGGILIAPLAHCDGRKVGRQQFQLALEKANRETLQEKARADELASAQRITDTIAVSRREGELRDAIAATPDTAPDAVRIQLGCARLRASGRSPATLPPVCGSGG